MPQFVDVQDLEKIVRGFNDRLTSLETMDPARGAGLWTAFTPTVTQSVGVSISSNNSAWARIGSLLLIQVNVALTSAGTTNNNIAVTMPAGVPNVFWHAGNTGIQTAVGSYLYFDTGTAIYGGAIHASAANQFIMLHSGQAGYLGVGPNFACANGDSISMIVATRAAGF